MSDDYERLEKAIRREALPVAVVDLDAVDNNVDALMAPVNQRNKQLRVATKSIRCVDLIRHVVDRAGSNQSSMSYAVREAAFLATHGFDDIFVAYPTVAPHDLEVLAKLAADGHLVSIAVDSLEHVDRIATAATRVATEVPVVIDVDMSLRLGGPHLHVGVRRSPLGEVEDVVRLAKAIVNRRGVRLDGLMGYEAQIAGVTDDNPFAPLLDIPKRAMKSYSRRYVRGLRETIVQRLRDEDLDWRFFNGGGSGSVHSTTDEPSITEVTVGSGFLDSHLFDYYRELSLTPAVFFAVQAVRRPTEAIITCHGGGYVASGESGKDRLPRPWLPRGLELIDLEGAGEVQTPLVVPKGIRIDLGQPVFFRHAKAGELAEHFNEYLFVRGDEIVHRAKTYRGEGACFL